ncbi:MAG: hypothetical protein M3Z41_04105 [Candidatus Eremiobacteraeota bacterium]|nr:hypothetical protein [Candidatus Eremiobacteraeota bacterium]
MLSRTLTCSALAVAFAAALSSHALDANAASPSPKAHTMAMPAAAKPVPTPNAAEAAFIADVTSALQARYPTTKAAADAGYFQMTRLEDDGTVIWFNKKWDAEVTKYAPNFLWYDKTGRLVGLDYQYLVSTNLKPPGAAVFPVRESRWTTIDAHLHFAYKKPDGTIKRRGAELIPHVKGDPTAAQLRAAKLVPANATVLWSHYHPKSWDLGFWLVPNPKGAFAELNPLVKP